MIEKKVLSYIQKNKLIQAGDALLIGVSGGADSMALLYFLDRHKDVLNCRIGVAHLHHDIRGEVADEDARYVKNFCDDHHIPFFFKKVNVIQLAKNEKIGVEEAGRKARYAFFDEAMNEKGYNLLATAHHMDDQAETLLMRLIRGTGLKGAIGIPCRQGKMIRPLLCVTKKEIESYCIQKNIETRYDYTNDDDRLTRNRIRHQIMPELKAINGSAIQHFSDFSSKVGEAQSFLNVAITEAEKKLFQNHPDYCEINNFNSLHPYLQKQILRSGIKKAGDTLVDVEQRHIEMILKKIKEDVTIWTLNLTNDVIVRREYDKLCFEKKQKVKSPFGCYTFPIDRSGIYYFENIQIKVEVLLTKSIKFEEYCKKDCSIFLSYDTINKSVYLRSRRTGDQILLPGTEGHKKVKSLFIDRKIPKDLRDLLPLLAIDKDVLMVPGVAKDKRYIRPDLTQEKTIKITLEFMNESRYRTHFNQ